MFNPMPFLAAIREMYGQVVVGGTRGPEVMEYGAFAEMLYTRTSVRADGAILFKLYPEFAMGSSARALARKVFNKHDVRVTCFPFGHLGRLGLKPRLRSLGPPLA